jgi:hypothetical protein
MYKNSSKRKKSQCKDFILSQKERSLFSGLKMKDDFDLEISLDLKDRKNVFSPPPRELELMGQEVSPVSVKKKENKPGPDIEKKLELQQSSI